MNMKNFLIIIVVVLFVNLVALPAGYWLRTHNLSFSDVAATVVQSVEQTASPLAITGESRSSETVSSANAASTAGVANAYYGVSKKASGYTNGDIRGFGNTNHFSKSSAITVAPDRGEYIVWASPSVIGARTFSVSGFAGGFQDPEQVDGYLVYRSVNPGLGTTTVTIH